MRGPPQRVLALAPDAASAGAARSQATPSRWSSPGASEVAVWGYCQGSARYQVCVELAGPAYRCTCPSRKIPCKHALALLLMWSAGGVSEAAEPDWVAAWLAERAARAGRRGAAGGRGGGGGGAPR